MCVSVCGCSSLRSLCHLSWWEKFAESVSLRALDTTNNREECTIQYSNNDSLSLLHLITLLQFFLFQYSTFTYLLHTALFSFLIFYVYISLSVSVDIFSLVKNYFVCPCALDWGGGISIKHRMCVCVCVCVLVVKSKLPEDPCRSFPELFPMLPTACFTLEDEKKIIIHIVYSYTWSILYIYKSFCISISAHTEFRDIQKALHQWQGNLNEVCGKLCMKIQKPMDGAKLHGCERPGSVVTHFVSMTIQNK